MQSTTSIVSHVYPAGYMSPLFRVRQIMDLCHTVGNERWVTVTCIVDPSNDSTSDKSQSRTCGFPSQLPTNKHT